MTEFEKKSIENFRRLGYGYKKIARILNISRDKARYYCKNVNIEPALENDEKGLDVCKNCGSIFKRKTRGRRQQFCCENCRYIWWRNHPEKINRRETAYYHLECAYCGKKFTSYGNKRRKYCSHDCYIRDRFWKKEDMAKIMECLKENKKPDFIPRWIKEKLEE